MASTSASPARATGHQPGPEQQHTEFVAEPSATTAPEAHRESMPFTIEVIGGCAVLVKGKA